MALTTDSLSKRQQELNAKVKDAVRNNVSFDELKLLEEKSDVDRLFKIDVASKYRNIDYIVEMLKSGDSLYISRAMKCLWIYDDKFSAIINSDFLHHHVFPFMPLKLRKKFLSTISTYVRNENRAASFFTYCVNIKLNYMALKFLVSTSVAFKLNFIDNRMINSDVHINVKSDYFMSFIDKSFDLADAFLQKSYDWPSYDILYILRYLYSVSDEKYLDLLEKHIREWQSYGNRFGLRLSKDIFKKHKKRVLVNPKLYINMLNKHIISKNSSTEDAKTFAIGLLPHTVQSFWGQNYCQNFKFIIDLIPADQRFEFVKTIFCDKYPHQPFEMTVSFHQCQYHKFLMLEHERELWALRHIESQQEILGRGNDFIWYKFVNFEKAFFEIKRYIMITQDQNLRSEMVNILVESAKNHKDLTTLLNYYYGRHVNEDINNKYRFLDLIFNLHNVFEFEETCWKAYDDILHSIEVYDTLGFNNCKDEFKVTALIYYVIHDKQLPDALNQYIDSSIRIYLINSQCTKLTVDQIDKLYNFLFQFYVKKVDSFENQDYGSSKLKIRKYLHCICELITSFNKKKEDIPVNVMKFIELDWEAFRHLSLFYVPRPVTELFNQAHLIRLLKQDKQLVVDRLPAIKDRQNMKRTFNFTQLLKKLRIYFVNDIAKDYLDFFSKMLTENSTTLACLYNVANVLFQVGDKELIADFMLKYAPTSPKIDHKNIDRHILHIQEAICRFAYLSRPPVPLENMILFIKGDYVHYCLPMFNHYLTNLPPSLCYKFVERILDSPLSIQKHGIRLAFKCFTIEDLKKLIVDVWKKTKNVSLRWILYKTLFDKILNEEIKAQKELFEALKMFNLDLHEDDIQEIFDLITSNQIPQDLRGDYLESAWKSVCKLPPKAANLERQARVIQCMEFNIKLLKRGIIKPIVDEHINVMLEQKQIRPKYSRVEIDTLNKAKWELVARYVVYFDDEDKLDISLQLVQFISKNCFEMWNVIHDNIYTIRQFYSMFTNLLISKSEWIDYLRVNFIFQSILDDYKRNLPIQDIYLTEWRLRLTICTRSIIYEAKMKNHSMETVAHDVTNEIVSLVNEYTEMNMYYPSFQNDVFQIIRDNILKISSDKVLRDDFLIVHVALNLTNINTSETYLLAVHMLPADCPRGVEDVFLKALNKIKTYENIEVQCLATEKFVNSSFYKRRLM